MGFLAALLWGFTDFLIGINARSVGVRQAVFFSQAFGLLLMISIIVVSGNQWAVLTSAPLSVVIFGVTASIFTVSGALALSKAFQVGKTALVAPLVTMYGVFTTLLSWMGGEVLSGWQLSGILICAVGVLFASAGHSRGPIEETPRSYAPFMYALLAAMLYGTSFWVQGKFALPTLGPINMLVLGYAIGVIALIPESLKFLRRSKTLKPLTLLSLVSASVLNLGAFSAFSWGVVHGSISVVTVISTLSGAIAAVLGYFFHQERLSLRQMFGVGLALAGTMSIHFYG
jgi:drug/metabolite transporter (DMT)-like permease